MWVAVLLAHDVGGSPTHALCGCICPLRVEVFSRTGWAHMHTQMYMHRLYMHTQMYMHTR